MGIAVILLTILVRLLLLRYSIKAEKSRLALQKLQPEVEKIKKQFKDDKERQTKEMLALYQKRGINPFSSCLPTLFQFPFLIGLFIVFREGLKNGFPLYGPVKGLVSNLAINSQAFGFLDLTSSPGKGILLIFPILAGILQYIQSRMMIPNSSGPTSSPQQSFNYITLLLPVIIFWFALSLPSALSLYFIATTLFAIVQQYLIDKAERGKTLDQLQPKIEKKET